LQNLVIAIAAIASLLVGYYLGNLATDKVPELQAATLLPDAKPIGDFELVDFDNQPFTLDGFKGHWNLVFFGYTHCPDICPTALTSMVEVNKALDSHLQAQVQTVFVSVDPERDTPDHLKEYVGFFSPDFIGVTGEDAQIRELTRQLGLQYKLLQADDKGNYLVDHSSYLIIINPAGQLQAVVSGAHYPNPQAIAEDLAIIADIY